MSVAVAYEVGRLKPAIEGVDGIAAAGGDLHGAALSLPGLRWYWTGGVNQAANLIDVILGHDYRLDDAGGPLVSAYGGVSHGKLDGVDDRWYHSNVNHFRLAGDDAYIDTSIRGATLGGWFRSSSWTPGRPLMCMWGAVGERSYLLSQSVMEISSNGTDILQSSRIGPSTGTWHFIVGRFKPGVEIDHIVNMDVATAATTATAINQTTTADFEIGANAPAGWFEQIDFALLWLCAAYVDNDTLQAVYDAQKGKFA